MNERREPDPSVRGAGGDLRLTLVDATRDGAQLRSAERRSAIQHHDGPRSPDVTFFLRAMPASQGWTWRLFARTGVSGTPRLVYSADRTFETAKDAIDWGRRALATGAAVAAAESKPPVARAG